VKIPKIRSKSFDRQIHAPTATLQADRKADARTRLVQDPFDLLGRLREAAAFRHHFPKEGAQTQLVRRIVLRSSAENGGEFDERQFVSSRR